MPVIPKAQRLTSLEHLGLSPQLLGIASGKKIPEGLRFWCEPIHKVYGDGNEEREQPGPEGFMTLPLWECGTRITAVCEASDGLTFFDYSLEVYPFEVDAIAHTEQGLRAYMFVTLIESEDENLSELADELGFQYFALVEERYRSMPHQTWEQQGAFLLALTAEVDALEGGRAGTFGEGNR